MLSTQTIQTVKATVPVIQEHGATVTKVFYDNLLAENSELNPLFNHGNQATGHQPKALAHAVLAYAQYIETPEVLSAAIKHITQKHASLFIRPEQYPIVGKYLLGAFAQVLGAAFTSEIQAAWAEAYTELANTMIAAEAELYRQANDWTDWRDFVVQDKIRESSEITSFILRPTDQKPLPKYLPGQYVSVRVMIPALSYHQIRQYSLSDSFTPDHYRISVRREPGVTVQDVSHPGLVSTVLHVDTQVGDTVQLSRPSGTFALEKRLSSSTSSTSTATTDETPLVLISAGVGVTPMVSMLNSTLTETPHRAISWIQGANSSQKRAFSTHIDAVGRENDNVRVVRFLSRPEETDHLGSDYDHAGRVDLMKCDADLCLFLKDPAARYFVCGPVSFMDSMKEQLLGLGVESSRIAIERFGTGGF